MARLANSLGNELPAIVAAGQFSEALPIYEIRRAPAGGLRREERS